MGIQEPFYLSTNSIHTVALNQLKQKDPQLYHQVQDYQSVFLQFVVNQVIEGVKLQGGELDDDFQLWEMTTRVIHSTIALLADSFMEQVASILRTITNDPSEEDDTCPICLEPNCTAELSCCGKGIHPACFAGYLRSGYARCALCRKEFRLT